MSKVLTFSRVFPSYHPRKGENTYFHEKILRSIYGLDIPRIHELDGINNKETEFILSMQPKHHTIRVGHRWKSGDWFSPREWSGKPYASKQIIIAPDIQVKKVWDISMRENGCVKEFYTAYTDLTHTSINQIATNDGLTVEDFYNWFDRPFTGQIICWNENINY